MINYRLIEGTDKSNVVAFDPTRSNPILEADSSHPHFKTIVAGLQAGDESVLDLFDVALGVNRKFTALSERVSFDGKHVLFDGDVVENELTELIARGLRQGVEDYLPYVKFMEKASENPNKHSREQMFSWLAGRQFSITENGDIVAYKGVVRDGDSFKSSSSGRAVVDGQEYTGQIPNPLGAVVTMPRSEVQHDPQRGCHTGLHVGTWDYASNFASATLEIHINPRDVVSVPTDCNYQKMRVCRYKVVQEIGSHYNGKSVVFAAKQAPVQHVSYAG